MFANTLTITIDGVAHVLTRVNQDNFGSQYTKKTALDVMSLQFRNSVETVKNGDNTDRHNMFFEHRVFATTLVPERLYTMSAVLRVRDGGDPVYLGKVATGFNTLLAAQIPGLINGES